MVRIKNYAPSAENVFIRMRHFQKKATPKDLKKKEHGISDQAEAVLGREYAKSVFRTQPVFARFLSRLKGKNPTVTDVQWLLQRVKRKYALKTTAEARQKFLEEFEKLEKKYTKLGVIFAKAPDMKRFAEKKEETQAKGRKSTTFNDAQHLFIRYALIEYQKLKMAQLILKKGKL